MPLRTETYSLKAEEERLVGELEAIADEVAAMDDGDSRKQERIAEGRRLDSHLEGVRWAQTAHDDEDVPAWDENVDTVTLAGLTGGEAGRVGDDASEEDAGYGGYRVFYVEAGSETVPYIDDGMAKPDRLVATGSLPLSYLKWAEQRIGDLSGGSSGNADARRFGDMLAEKRQTTTSTEQ